MTPVGVASSIDELSQLNGISAEMAKSGRLDTSNSGSILFPTDAYDAYGPANHTMYWKAINLLSSQPQLANQIDAYLGR